MPAGLTLDLRVGERVDIDGGRIALVVEHKTGQRTRIRIEADPSISIVPRSGRRAADRDDARSACMLPQV